MKIQRAKKAANDVCGQDPEVLLDLAREQNLDQPDRHGGQRKCNARGHEPDMSAEPAVDREANGLVPAHAMAHSAATATAFPSVALHSVW